MSNGSRCSLPFRAFHNITEHDQLACLKRVREHLRPGGPFAFNVFHPSLEYMAQVRRRVGGNLAMVRDMPAPPTVAESSARKPPSPHQAPNLSIRFTATKSMDHPRPDITAQTPVRLRVSHRRYQRDVLRMEAHSDGQTPTGQAREEGETRPAWRSAGSGIMSPVNRPRVPAGVPRQGGSRCRKGFSSFSSLDSSQYYP